MAVNNNLSRNIFLTKLQYSAINTASVKILISKISGTSLKIFTVIPGFRCSEGMGPNNTTYKITSLHINCLWKEFVVFL